MKQRGALLAAALVLVTAIAITPAAAKARVTNYQATTGTCWGGTAAPNCYPAEQVYTGNATCFGATYLGGVMSFGALMQVNPSGTSVKTIYSFNVVLGLMPSQAPILMPDGRTLVGTTSQGGSSGSGLIYAYNLETATMKTLASFTGPGGSTPQAPPIQVNGTIYGTAGQGGAYGYGVIWTVPSTGGPIKVMHSFQGGKNDTATPFGALTFNPADGLLYGLGFAAGQNDLGAVFSIARNGSNYKLRASLSDATGGAPQMGALVLGKDGSMYGHGWVGGQNKSGTIFRFDPKTSAVTTVFSYNNLTGTQPYNTPAVSPSGQWLYAVTWQGGQGGVGTVVAVATNGSTYKVLLQQSLAKTGGLSFANPTVSLDGNVLITQMGAGGKYGVGSLVSVDIPADVK